MAFIFGMIIAYLIGSISCAILVAKYLKLPDPRLEGSGNPGATNMLRIAGKKPGLIVLIGDGLKGLIAVLIGKLLGVAGAGLALIALAAVLGHIFSIFYQFKGGKGVATALGAILGLSFWIGIFVIAIWFIVAWSFKYASLASLVAIVAAPILMLISGNTAYFVPVLIITGLVVWKHWENIEKLKQGTESKIQNF